MTRSFYMSGLLTCFSSPGLLLQGHQQGGKNQLHPVGTQVPHHSFGTVICSLVEEKAGAKNFKQDHTQTDRGQELLSRFLD